MASKCPNMQAYPDLTNMLVQFCCIFTSTASLLTPAIINGFPLLYQDTGGYLDRGYLLNLGFGRSLFYGIFLRTFTWPVLGLWPAVTVQALLTAWVIAVMARTEGYSTFLRLVGIAVVLALGTSAPFFASQLTPDFSGSCLVLAAWLLSFRSQQLTWRARWGLMAVAAGAILAHMSYLILGLGLVVLIHLAHTVNTRFSQSFFGFGTIERWRLTSVVFVAVVALPLGNGLITGRYVFTPGGPIFLLGRLVQDGIAQQYLNQVCPDPRLKLCTFKDNLPRTTNDFLWGPEDAPLRQVGGLDGAGDEARQIVLESLTLLPWLHIIKAVENTAAQFFLTRSSEGLTDDMWHTKERLGQLLPGLEPSFMAALQQREEKINLSSINTFHASFAWCCFQFLSAYAVVCLRRSDRESVTLIIFIFLALLGNAFICGTLSNPAGRYQGRLIWLVPFCAMLVVLRIIDRGVRDPDCAPHVLNRNQLTVAKHDRLSYQQRIIVSNESVAFHRVPSR